jgi:hypothetical protein
LILILFISGCTNKENCTDLKNQADSLEKKISKYCESDSDCESRPYRIDSLSNAVNCFEIGDKYLKEYDSLYEAYRDSNCPMNMGGAPYSEVSCKCIENECTPFLVP